MKAKKLIGLSLAIPVLFVLLAEIKGLLEYYFRGSEKYRYIYSYGATITFFIQLFLLVASFLLGIYIFTNRKQYSFLINMLSLFFGLSVFLYFTIGLLYAFIATD